MPTYAYLLTEKIKLSKKWVLNPIIWEELNVSGLVKNRNLARAISLQGWREFRSLIDSKSEKFGRDFRVISRWEPTSQKCSECGFKWGKIDLSVRSILCLGCGIEHNRDDRNGRHGASERPKMYVEGR
ncbi:transposase [Oscillatoria salina]|uniref:transposase n=1 Tax=Oscillatoria salina TaxID=331517 RepID=UPI0029621CCC|nr:transposase [Oscillatoria salina]